MQLSAWAQPGIPVSDAWTGNRWTVEEVRVKDKTKYVARNERDGQIANDHRHETREQAQRQADLLNAFLGQA